MNTHIFLLQSIITIAFFNCTSLAKDNSSLNLLSVSSFGYFDPNSNSFNDWASYYKKTEAKLDHVLAKCFECIEKKIDYNNVEVCSGTTGMNSISKNGVINAGASFLNGINSYGSHQTNAFSLSLSCMVGPVYSAAPTACEYGNSYCQVSLENGVVIYYSCAAVCWPSDLNICTTGTLSNKLGPLCLTGNLNEGSDQAFPYTCETHEACGLFSDKPLYGECVDDCDPTDDTTEGCFFSDFGNKQGPLCYAGIFGVNATIVGCGKGGFCVAYSMSDGTINGECSGSENGSGQGTLISSSLLDFGNKQGVICFVGQFSDNSIAIACLKNQVCQRLTLHTELGSTITTGSCVSKCVPSLNTYCCSSDLCNGYQSEIGTDSTSHKYNYKR